jgi:hypothetical protein
MRLIMAIIVIELHAWRRPDDTGFATFVYEKGAERLLRHFTGFLLFAESLR